MHHTTAGCCSTVGHESTSSTPLCSTCLLAHDGSAFIANGIGHEHPALLGSIASAAQPYGVLRVSPFSPWRGVTDDPTDPRLLGRRDEPVPLAGSPIPDRRSGSDLPEAEAVADTVSLEKWFTNYQDGVSPRVPREAGVVVQQLPALYMSHPLWMAPRDVAEMESTLWGTASPPPEKLRDPANSSSFGSAHFDDWSQAFTFPTSSSVLIEEEESTQSSMAVGATPCVHLLPLGKESAHRDSALDAPLDASPSDNNAGTAAAMGFSVEDFYRDEGLAAGVASAATFHQHAISSSSALNDTEDSRNTAEAFPLRPQDVRLEVMCKELLHLAVSCGCSYAARSTVLTGKAHLNTDPTSLSFFPLCPSCWRGTRLPQMKKIVVGMSEVAAAMQAIMPPDLSSLAVCLETQRGEQTCHGNIGTSARSLLSLLISPNQCNMDTVALALVDDPTVSQAFLLPEAGAVRHIGPPLTPYGDENTVSRPVHSLSESSPKETNRALQEMIAQVEKELRERRQEVHDTRGVYLALEQEGRSQQAEWDARAEAENQSQAGPALVAQEERVALLRSIKRQTQSLHLMHGTPLCVWVFPIRVTESDPYGRIAGLRLGARAEQRAPPRPRSEPQLWELGETRKDDKDAAKGFQPLLESEELRLLHHNEMRQVLYTAPLLSGLEPTVATGETHVSAVELNTACGYLLHLLCMLATANRYTFRTAVLHPRGEQSTIDVLANVQKCRGLPLPTASVGGGAEVTKTVDFFISQKFFAWRTFPAACGVVLQCVQELCEVLESALQCWSRRQQLARRSGCREGAYARAQERIDQRASPAMTSVLPSVAFPPPITACPPDLSIVPQTLSEVVAALVATEEGATGTMDDAPSTNADPPDRVPWGGGTAPEASLGEGLGISAKPPFAMTTTTVDGFSVLHGSVSDVVWTIAMKRLLANVKWCVKATHLRNSHRT